MKNKNKKIASLTVIMTLVITMVVGLINPVSIVKAEDTKSVRIKDVLNNDEIVSDDEKLILSKTGEKISDDELKVSLKIKGNNEENINIYNASIKYTLNSGFEVVENSINVVGIDEDKKESVNVTTEGEKTNIEFGDIDTKEVEVSFLVKVKDGVKAEENIEVTSEAKLVYTLLENKEDNQENTEIDFPKLYVSLESIVAEKEATEENVENEIIEDITKEEEKTEENAKEDKEDIENEVADDTAQENGVEDTNSEDTINGAEENIDNDIAEDEVVVANESIIKNENKANNSTTTSSGVTINKTAELVDDETVKITLTAEGEVTRTDAKNADIVMVIDKSGSMNDKLDKIKEAATNFTNNILSNTQGSDVRIAIVTYDYYGKYNGYQGQGSYLNLGFSSSKDDINTAINAITAEGGTNTQAGIRRAAETLKEARTDAKKYVVFFTDGLPTQSYYDNNTINGNGTRVDSKYMEDAQKEYNKYFTSWNKTSSSVIYPDTKFYSVGVFTNASDNEKKQAVDFLKTIQNVIEPEKFGEKYYTQDLSNDNINSIFTDISKDIKDNINNTVATNVTINDIVTDYFNIINGSWKVTDLKGNVINTQPEVTGNNITFKIGNISVSQGESKGGVIVTFNAKVKDAYFGGKNIDTNVSANITYNDGQKQEFNIPNVDIPLKQGTIKIKKEIVEKGLLRGWNKVSDDEVNKDDKFSISVVGNEKYTVNLTENSEETLNFYLKGENTDISKNDDTSLGYLTVGQYKIEELLPMNYEQVGVYVETGGKIVKLEDWKNYDKETKTFTIDKDNNDITIIVRNTLVNKGYWFDKADVENQFRYYNPKTQQKPDTSIY